MNILSASNRLSILGSLALLVAAGAVGCSSPVGSPDDASLSPMSKKRTATTSAWETEPNNDPATTTDVINGGKSGHISTAADNDYFVTVAVLPGKVLTVNLAMPYAKDYDVQVLASDGVTLVASNHQGAGVSETIYVTNTSSTSQTYKLRVFSADGTSSTTSPYTLIASVN
jgi:hypothetical protein